jgi:hypothetical protein
MKSGPLDVIELLSETLNDWVLTRLTKRFDDGIGSDDPEHVKPAKGIEGYQPPGPLARGFCLEGLGLNIIHCPNQNRRLAVIAILVPTGFRCRSKTA